MPAEVSKSGDFGVKRYRRRYCIHQQDKCSALCPCLNYHPVFWPCTIHSWVPRCIAPERLLKYVFFSRMLYFPDKTQLWKMGKSGCMVANTWTTTYKVDGTGPPQMLERSVATTEVHPDVSNNSISNTMATPYISNPHISHGLHILYKLLDISILVYGTQTLVYNI